MKRIVSTISITLVLVVMLGMIVSSAASGPNHGWLDWEAGLHAKAHVQIQPSYLDSGRHALQGKVRLVVQPRIGDIYYSSYAFTDEAINILDSNYYTAEVGLTVLVDSQCNAQPVFHWFPSGDWSTTDYEATE